MQYCRNYDLCLTPKKPFLEVAFVVVVVVAAVVAGVWVFCVFFCNVKFSMTIIKWEPGKKEHIYHILKAGIFTFSSCGIKNFLWSYFLIHKLLYSFSREIHL